MRRVELAVLLQDVGLEFVSSRIDMERFAVSSLSTDTRSLKKGDFFLAIPGEQHDGHTFVVDALDRGASGVLFEISRKSDLQHIIESSPETLFVAVSDSRKALGSMARNYSKLFNPIKFALTGSAGKTTTKGLIHSVLSQKFNVVCNVRSFNNDIGVPKTLFNIESDTEVLVQEVGTNHPGEIACLASLVEPDCALVTNVGPAHVGYFGSVRAIVREKRELLRSLSGDGTAFVNVDDPYAGMLMRGLRASVKTFGINGGDTYPDRITKMAVSFAEFILQGIPVKANVLGIHGVVNAIAAAAVGKHFGLTLDQVKRGIEAFEGESGRGRIHTRKGVTFVDESYNANPLSVAASLAYLGGMEAAGRKIFIFADMLELGKHSCRYHRKVADTVLEQEIDIVYTFGEQAGITASRCSALGHKRVYHFDDIKTLSAKLAGVILKGDVVLVKGSRAMRLERAIESFV